MRLAQRIRKIREAKCLTQEEVANRCDICASTYGQIEREAENSSFKTLTKIANGIGVTICFLIDIENENYTEK